MVTEKLVSERRLPSRNHEEQRYCINIGTYWLVHKENSGDCCSRLQSGRRGRCINPYPIISRSGMSDHRAIGTGKLNEIAYAFMVFISRC
jgi:hypothetical protein